MRYLTAVMTFAIVFVSVGCSGGSANIDNPPPVAAVMAKVNEMSPSETVPKVEAAYSQFVDVRTPEEYSSGHAIRAINIPLNELEGKLDRLEKNEPVYLICETGRRSKLAGDILAKNGFKWIFSVDGGMARWRAEGLQVENVKRN